VIVSGLMELMVGAATIVNLRLFDVTPPDVTLTCAVPGLATRLAGTVAVTSLALWNDVASALPAQLTIASEPKPVPLTVRVKAALPAVIVSGSRLLTAGPATMVMVCAFEVELLVRTVI
jgi:hypothetical protein